MFLFAVELINLSEEKLEMRLKRSFQVLESALLSDTTNPSLDPKFYFRVPVRVLEALPLEAMDGNNHLAVSSADLLYFFLTKRSRFLLMLRIFPVIYIYCNASFPVRPGNTHSVGSVDSQ